MKMNELTKKSKYTKEIEMQDIKSLMEDMCLSKTFCNSAKKNPKWRCRNCDSIMRHLRFTIKFT